MAAQNLEAKSAALRQLLSRRPRGACPREEFARALEPFLQKFGYAAEFLKEIPAAQQLEFRGQKYYCKKNIDETRTTYERAALPRPVANRLFMLEGDIFTEPDLGRTFAQLRMPAYKKEIARWYEKDLPEELARLGLRVKKVMRRPAAQTNAAPAELWEIIAGLEKFNEKPLVRFAPAGPPKLDLVPLHTVALTAAKFNLTPAQVVVATGGHAAAAPAACYDVRAARVTLGSPSLALLAHEGWHHLVAAGLVPPRAYAAVVAAGQRAAPRASARANYPAAAPSAEEAAARFVETYYETPGRARQELLAPARPILAQALNYLRALGDRLLGAGGNSSAQARNFLRRVERGDFTPAAGKCHPAPGESV